MEDQGVVDLRRDLQRRKRKLLFILLIIVLLIILSGTITRSYGPFYGKVVDIDTGKPIENAAVILRFDAIFYLSPGGATTSFVDSIETITGSDGEFFIEKERFFSIKPFHYWDTHVSFEIFKPGYSNYPNNQKSNSNTEIRIYINEKKCNLVKLKKLDSFSDREENLMQTKRLLLPHEKIKIFSKYIEEERRHVLNMEKYQ